ncbi:MAG TPA: hypothetical protein VJR05_12005 [Acidimicrobiia bacterium]|nr:hypothetical protein [Acidimicrobiia bacterium]
MEIDPTTLDVRLFRLGLESAQRALREMDDEHVPANLRDIARRSGRLPPPLATRLLVELDGSDWLREEALAFWPGLDPDELTGAQKPSYLFLRRPPGWEEELRQLTQVSAEKESGRAALKLATDLGRANRRIELLEAELEKASLRAAEAEGAAAQRLKDQAERFRRSRRETQVEIKRLRQEVVELGEQLTGLAEAMNRAQQELSRLRERRPSPSPPRPRAKGAWEVRAPAELARHLDDLMIGGLIEPLLPAERLPGEAPPTSPERLKMPPPLRPDRAESLSWLIEQPQLIVVAIDGWNAAHLLASPPTTAERDRVVEAARRVLRMSRGRRRVLVFFDSSLAEAEYNLEIEVRYVASADEELVGMAASHPPTVVVSSDRLVRERAEAKGALGLWSEALIDWLPA